VLLGLVPAWFKGSTTEEKPAHKKTSANAALRTGTSPVGISAAIATIFPIVFFLLM
jgi:hypothetical protein